MTTSFQWKNSAGNVGSIWAERTNAGVVLVIAPEDDFYAGELGQFQAAELMLHFYSLLKQPPVMDLSPESLLMLVRGVCTTRIDGDRVLGFIEICALLGIPLQVEPIRYELDGRRLADGQHHSLCSHDTRRGCNCGVEPSALEVSQ